MQIKVTSKKTIISGSVYLVIAHHYMGMDGDFYSPLGSYTNETDAGIACQRFMDRCDHINDSYDSIYYYVEEIPLIA